MRSSDVSTVTPLLSSASISVATVSGLKELLRRVPLASITRNSISSAPIYSMLRQIIVEEPLVVHVNVIIVPGHTDPAGGLLANIGV